MSEKFMENYISFANDLCEQTGNIIRAALQTNLRFETKDDQSPVTEIDQKVEKLVRERISEHFPDHGILGEEYGAQATDQEYVWVIDPIDGTKAFISGFAVFGTLISLTRKGKPVLGIIDNPVTGERWIGAQGALTKKNGKAISGSLRKDILGSLLSNGNPDSLNDKEKEKFTRLKRKVAWCVYGGSCQAYGRLADGALDIVIDSGLDPFDYCALSPIITGAGGCITDWEGQELTLWSGSRCVASASPELHEIVLETLAD